MQSSTKNQEYTEKDAEYFTIASDAASKLSMVAIDIFMTLERMGFNEEDASKLVRLTLVDFSENGINFDFTKFVFNFVENLKKYAKNIRVN